MLLSWLFLVIIFFIAINLLLLKYLVLNKYVNFWKIRIYSHLFKETKEPFDDRYRVFLHSEVNFSSIDLIKDNPGAYSSREEDLIGIDNHVDSTYNIISSINTKDFYSFSIWIVWGWGVGKTSFINSLKTKYLYADSRIKLLDFRPWNYEGSVLIEHFLKELSISIDDRGLYRDINKYLVSLWKIYPRFTFLNYFSAKSSEDIRSEISKKLSRLTNKKIVVIIDDLDRCWPGEILSIFNIIKNVGYFKNIIYLISYDKEKVVKTLEEKKYSSDYLDKIINIEKNIPKANDSNLKEFFKDELLKIFTELDTDELKNSNSIIRLNHYLDHVVYELNTVSFFDNTNIRAIKRILNHIKITVHLEYSKQSSIFNRYIKDSIQVYPISFYDSDISSHVSVYNKLFYKSFITPIILGNICKVKDELWFYEGLKHWFSVGNYYWVFDLIRNMYVNAKNENQTDDFYKRFSIFS